MYFKTQQHRGPWGLYQIIKQSCNTLKHFDTGAPHLGNRVPSRRASLRVLASESRLRNTMYVPSVLIQAKRTTLTQVLLCMKRLLSSITKLK